MFHKLGMVNLPIYLLCCCFLNEGLSNFPPNRKKDSENPVIAHMYDIAYLFYIPASPAVILSLPNMLNASPLLESVVVQQTLKEMNICSLAYL